MSVSQPGNADRRPLMSTTRSAVITSPAFVRTPVTCGTPASAEAPLTRPATAVPRRIRTPGAASAAAASTASIMTRLPVSNSKRSSPSCQPPVIDGGSTLRMKFSRSAPASASALATSGSSASTTARNPPRKECAIRNWFSPGRCQRSHASLRSAGGPSGSRSSTVTSWPSPARSSAVPSATTPPPTTTICAMACPRHPGPARQSEVSPAKPMTTGLSAPVWSSRPKCSHTRRGELRERPRHPVGDEGAHVRQVIEPDVLGAALLGGEYAQLPLGAGHGLLVGAVRVLKRDLPVTRAVRDEERHGDLLHHPVQVDLVGELDELLQVVVAPHPQHVLPVVRHRPLALALQAAPLHRAPVVVGAPGDHEREPFLERGGARRVVAAERPAGQPDRRWVDVGPGQQVIDARARPRLGVHPRGQPLQPQRLA